MKYKVFTRLSLFVSHADRAKVVLLTSNKASKQNDWLFVSGDHKLRWLVCFVGFFWRKNAIKVWFFFYKRNFVIYMKKLSLEVYQDTNRNLVLSLNYYFGWLLYKMNEKSSKLSVPVTKSILVSLVIQPCKWKLYWCTNIRHFKIVTDVSQLCETFYVATVACHTMRSTYRKKDFLETNCTYLRSGFTRLRYVNTEVIRII